MRAMISQPMNGLTDIQIRAVRDKASEELVNKGYTVVGTLFNDLELPVGVKNESIFYLAKSIEELSKVDALYMCSGWYKYRGCKIEHRVAEEYGLEIIYEDERWMKELMASEVNHDNLAFLENRSQIIHDMNVLEDLAEELQNE